MENKIINYINQTPENTNPSVLATLLGELKIPKPLTYDYMPEGYPSKSRFNMEWDGNTDGLAVVEVAPNRWYKVSASVVDPTVFASGATLTYADGSTDFMSIDAEKAKNRITIEPGKVMFGEGQVIIFTETPEPPFETFEIGVYFESDDICDVRKVIGGGSNYPDGRGISSEHVDWWCDYTAHQRHSRKPGNDGGDIYR